MIYFVQSVKGGPIKKRIAKDSGAGPREVYNWLRGKSFPRWPYVIAMAMHNEYVRAWVAGCLYGDIPVRPVLPEEGDQA